MSRNVSSSKKTGNNKHFKTLSSFLYNRLSHDKTMFSEVNEIDFIVSVPSILTNDKNREDLYQLIKGDINILFNNELVKDIKGFKKEDFIRICNYNSVTNMVSGFEYYLLRHLIDSHINEFQYDLKSGYLNKIIKLSVSKDNVIIKTFPKVSTSSNQASYVVSLLYLVIYHLYKHMNQQMSIYEIIDKVSIRVQPITTKVVYTVATKSDDNYSWFKQLQELKPAYKFLVKPKDNNQVKFTFRPKEEFLSSTLVSDVHNNVPSETNNEARFISCTYKLQKDNTLKCKTRVVDLLLSKEMGYKYLGFWQDRENNSNIEIEPLTRFLQSQGYSDELISKAINHIEAAAKLGAGNDNSDKLYNANKEFYSLLRYGASFKLEGSNTSERVQYINWNDFSKNDFDVAEEVTYKGNHEKRPDIVIYVNGIALAVIELKSGRVDVAEAIRQNLTNQRREITQFFTTVQFVIAGNESQGLRYGTTLTPEKYYLQWKEYNPETKEAVKLKFFDEITVLLNKTRFLEIIHDFIVFDCGIKKLCRQNQYFGVKCAQKRIQDNKDGIIWHTQGSGKSLTMVWLAKWYKEFYPDGRVLVITDRVELDEQIEGVFAGVGETIVRTKCGSDLIDRLNLNEDRLMCSLVHKFGCATKSDDKVTDEFIQSLREKISKDFSPKGKILVFVDECHRTQSGKLHEAMKEILPNAIFIGFTGTPLLKENKESIKTFGSYIHTYKFKEAVEDEVVLDLRYEPRDVPQYITQQDKIDKWFELKTSGLSETAKTKLKKQWANLQVVSSSHSRLEKIANDIIFDFGVKERLESGKGNAMLVAGSIYEACKFWEIFQAKNFKKCAVVTSYVPSHRDIRTEDTGDETPSQTMEKYDIYLKMLGIDEATPNKDKVAEEYEKTTKEKFKKEPNNLKLLIVVDKLLTGFDAPSATYLYIDKKMQDHALFQAVCRVNRLDGETKDYGYIVDYKDLFEALEKSVHDYTSNAFANFDEEDIVGLLKDRKAEARADLDKAIERIDSICEDVNEPKSDDDYRDFFGCHLGDDDEAYNKMRLNMYKAVNSLIRAYANFKADILDAEYGYSTEMAKRIDEKVANYTRLKNLISLSSGDYIDLKAYESDMRTLIDNYIEAGTAHKLVDFDGMSLIEVIIGDNAEEEIGKIENQFGQKAVAETIANHIRRVVNYEYASNPEYYKKMSELLTNIIEEQKQDRIKYKEYLQKITELAKQVKTGGGNYPERINVKSLRALYDNLDNNEELALKLDADLRSGIPADYQTHSKKIKKVKQIIQQTLGCDDETTERIYSIVVENY